MEKMCTGCGNASSMQVACGLGWTGLTFEAFMKDYPGASIYCRPLGEVVKKTHSCESWIRLEECPRELR